MRSGGRLFLFVFAAALFAGGLASAAQDPFAPENLWATERRLAAELSLVRLERGLPSLLWCERMALPMRLYVELVAEAGYKGEGYPPAHLGRLSKRAADRHAWASGEIFENFGTARKDTWSPREQVDRMLSNKEIRSYTDPEMNAAACVLRDLGGGAILVLLAVAKVDERALAAELDAAGDAALRLFAATPESEKDALSRLWPGAGPEAVPFWLSLLREKSPGRRIAGLKALGALADPALVSELVAGLSDRDPGCREAALEALRAVTGRSAEGGDPVAWAAWWKPARDEFKPAGRLAPPPPPPPPAPAEGEARKGEAPPPPPVPESPPAPAPLSAADLDRVARKALPGAPPAAKMLIARGIGAAGNPGAAAALLPLLAEGAFPVSLEAARALERCADAALFPKLAPSLPKAQDPVVRWHLVRALGRTGDARAVPLLASACPRETNEALAAACARGLGCIRKEAAVSRLIEILSAAEASSRAVLAQAARSTLATMTGANPGQAASDWHAWWAKNKATFRFPD